MSRPQKISFFESFYAVISELKASDRLALYDAIMGYAFDGTEPALKSGTQTAVFTLIKPVLDSSAKRRTSGAKGGSASKSEANDKQSASDKDIGVGVRNKDIGVGVKENKKKKFTPPTIQDIEDYCYETGRSIDAERFVDFYASKGWMVGKNPMKDWKAAVRNWSKNDHLQNKNSSNPFTEMLRTGDY